MWRLVHGNSGNGGSGQHIKTLPCIVVYTLHSALHRYQHHARLRLCGVNFYQLFMVLRDVWYYVVGKERGCSPVIGRKQEMITDYCL